MAMSLGPRGWSIHLSSTVETTGGLTRLDQLNTFHLAYRRQSELPASCAQLSRNLPIKARTNGKTQCTHPRTSPKSCPIGRRSYVLFSLPFPAPTYILIDTQRGIDVLVVRKPPVNCKP